MRSLGNGFNIWLWIIPMVEKEPYEIAFPFSSRILFRTDSVDLWSGLNKAQIDEKKYINKVSSLSPISYVRPQTNPCIRKLRTPVHHSFSMAGRKGKRGRNHGKNLQFRIFRNNICGQTHNFAAEQRRYI